MAKKVKKVVLINGYKDWVRNRIGFLRDYYYLQAWEFMMIWADEQPEGHGSAGAKIQVDSRYLNAAITMFPYSKSFWDKGDLGTLGFFLIHEVSHIILDPLYQYAERATPRIAEEQLDTTLEQQNQTLARIVRRGLPKTFFTKEKYNL